MPQYKKYLGLGFAALVVIVITLVVQFRSADEFEVVKRMYLGTSQVNATVVLGAGKDIASGVSLETVVERLKQSEERQKLATDKLNDAGFLKRGEQKDLIKLAEQEADALRKIIEAVETMATLPLQEWSDAIDQLRVQTNIYNEVHGQIVKLDQ